MTTSTLDIPYLVTLKQSHSVVIFMKLIQVQSGVQPQIQIIGLAVRNDHVDLGLEYSQCARHVPDQAGLAGAQEEDGIDVVGVHQDPQLLGDLSRILALLGLLTVQIHPQRL